RLRRSAAGVRPVSQPPVRGLEPGPVLGAGRLLRAADPRRQRGRGPADRLPRRGGRAQDAPARHSPAHEATGEAGLPRRPPAGLRMALAKWMTAPDNPYFARASVNRMWGYFFGRGIVDPVDDFRSTNPPTHPELLDELARYFKQQKYDLKALMRTIVQSRTYQLSGETNSTNRM